jgi:hypothetical protein
MKVGQICNKPPVHPCFPRSLFQIQIARAIYGFWVVFPKDCSGDVYIGFCATHVNKVWNLNHVHLIFCWQQSNFSAFGLLPPILFKSCSCQLQSFFLLLQVSLNILSYVCGWLPTFVAPIHVSGSPTLLRLRNHCFTFMLFKFL